MCKGYKSKFVESLFKWIGKYLGHIFENFIIICEIHLAERFPYFLMWYTSQFVCKACLFICMWSNEILNIWSGTYFIFGPICKHMFIFIWKVHWYVNHLQIWDMCTICPTRNICNKYPTCLIRISNTCPTRTICTKSATCPTCPILTISPACLISPICSHMHNMGHIYCTEHMYDMYHKDSR